MPLWVFKDNLKLKEVFVPKENFYEKY